MPSKLIYFGNDQRSGDQALAGASALAINVVADGAGAVRRRPGITTWSGFPNADIPDAAAVTGITDFEGEVYYVTANRRIFKVDEDGLAIDLSTGGGPSYLAGSERPIFAQTAFRLVMTGGAAPEKVDSNETVAERLGGGPPDSTHVVALASKLLFNDVTAGDATANGRIIYSRTGSAGNETFDALDFTRAEARPDIIMAMFGDSNELFVFGSRTLQVFSPDASVGFAPQRALNYGCAAAYGIIQGDGEFSWMTEQRQLVTSDGRGLTVLSDPISRTLDTMDAVSDGYGFRWNADQFDCYCWQFPSDGRTFVFQAGGGWAQWHGWTDNQGHVLLPITAHHYWPDQNLHLVGLATGQIALLDSSAPTDLGGTIKAEVLTGFISHETDAVKHCESIKFTFQRGSATGPTEPQVLLSWRDNTGAFCTPIRMGLGTTGDYIFTVERRSLGTYRARQWRLEFTDAVDFVLARAEETFSMGGTN